MLVKDFGIANLHDLSIALVKVSKNMLKSGCSKLYEPMGTIIRTAQWGALLELHSGHHVRTAQWAPC